MTPQVRLLIPTVAALMVAQGVSPQTTVERIAQLCPAGTSDSIPVITGLVRDATTMAPVSNARVRITVLGVPDFEHSSLQADGVSAYVETDSTGTYAICGVQTGSRTVLHATSGNRRSRFVGLFFLSGGVSTGNDFHPLELPVWNQDLHLLPAEQQTAVVIGQVTDTTAAPVVSAEVTLTGTGQQTRTDATGRFAFSGLAPGVARIEVKRLGFRVFERDVELVAGDTVDLSTSSLEHLPIQLAQLTVTGVAPSEKLQEVGFFERQRRSGSGSFLTMADYASRWGEPVRTTEVLYSMRGLRPRATSVADGLGYVSVEFARCGAPPAIFVDGWYMGTASQVDVNSIVPTEWLEGIEAHRDFRFVNVGRGAAPGCGAIYLWTKPFDNEPEEDLPVEPGSRVRVTAPTLGLFKYVGEYLAGDRDTVYVRGETGATPIKVPVTAVTLMELRTGEQRRRLAGTGVGFAVGAIVGATTGIPNDSRIMSAAVLAMPGTFVGFLVGSVLKTDRWEPAVRDYGEQVGLGLSFRF